MYETIVDSMAWRPYASLTERQMAVLRVRLTVTPKQTSGHSKAPTPIKLYREDDARELFGIPRAYYMRERTTEHPILDRTSSGVPLSNFESRVRHTGQFADQAKAVDILVQILRAEPWGGTIFNAGCGSGKTVCGLSVAYRLGFRTLILVHREFLLRQWQERIAEFFPGARVGRIQQDKCDYQDCDFVIGLLSSLSRRNYTAPVYTAFGTVIADEVHRMGAVTWAPVIAKFSARYRLGLSATLRRKDKAERVFWDHIGQVGHVHTGAAMPPRLRVVKTGFEARPVMKPGGQIRPANRLTLTELEQQIAKDELRARRLADDLVGAVAAGRKVMVLAKRLDHLHLLKLEIEGLLKTNGCSDAVVDYYTGQALEERDGELVKVNRTPQQQLKAESANVILATNQLVAEALDIPALDVLAVATPLGDVEQAVGRVQRYCLPSDKKCARLCPWRAQECTGKPDPIVVDFVDRGISLAMSSFATRIGIYEELGANLDDLRSARGHVR